jgi:hypothetical protein
MSGAVLIFDNCVSTSQYLTLSAEHLVHAPHYYIETGVLRPTASKLLEIVGLDCKLQPSALQKLSTFQPVLEMLSKIHDLDRGWNSHDARPITRESMEAAVKFILEHIPDTSSMPFVVPTVRGGVQLEWHRGGFDIEIYINEEGKIEFFAADSTTGEEVEGDIESETLLLKNWLKRLE